MKFLILTLTSMLVSAAVFTSVLSWLSPNADSSNSYTKEDYLKAAREGYSIQPLTTTANNQPSGTSFNINDHCSNKKWQPEPYATAQGKVIRVIDGDTLTAYVEGEEVRIRLWGIDAPESDQSYGTEASAELAYLLPIDQPIQLNIMDIDQYGRIIALVQTAQQPININSKMVLEGLAYHWKVASAYNNRCLQTMQSNAQWKETGLWETGKKGLTRPWLHRAEQKKQRQLDQYTQPEEEPSTPEGNQQFYQPPTKNQSSPTKRPTLTQPTSITAEQPL